MSMLMHVILVLMLFFWANSARQGSGEEAGRSVGIAVAHRLTDRTEYQEITPEAATESTQSGENSNSANNATAVAAAPPALARPVDLAGFLAEATAIPSPESSAGKTNALEATSGGGGGISGLGAGGAPVTTMFFGVSGSGRRFAYVFDRSDSMGNSDSRPLRAAKSEIIRSLRLLGPDQSFQIIFYNNRPNYFEPSGQSFWLLPADDAMKRRAEQFVRAIGAEGGTEHFDALKMALRLEPDVIFFLTDARIPQLRRNQLDEIRNRCVRAGTTIHAIEFGVDVVAPEVSFLRTLAAENQGEYRYIDVQTLQVRPIDGDSVLPSNAAENTEGQTPATETDNLK